MKIFIYTRKLFMLFQNYFVNQQFQNRKVNLILHLLIILNRKNLYKEVLLPITLFVNNIIINAINMT